MQYLASILLATAGLVSTAAVRATPIQITVTGVVTYSEATYTQGYSGDVFGFGNGFDTLTGKSVVQTFVYDPDVPTIDYSATESIPNQALLVRKGDNGDAAPVWISVTTTVDGVTFSEPPYAQDPDIPHLLTVDGLTLVDRYDASNYATFGDLLIIDQGTGQYVAGNGGKTLNYSRSSVRIDHVSDFLSGLTPDLQFSIPDVSHGPIGNGTVSRSQTWQATGAPYPLIAQGYFHYSIRSVTAQALTPAVPEPGTWALLGIGLPAVWLLRRRGAV